MEHAFPLLMLEEAFDERRCGGKAANLARLTRAGLGTAQGFVLPTEAFEEHLATFNAPTLPALFERWARIPLEEAYSEADALRGGITSAPLTAEIEASIGQICATLRPGVRLAVRSSAIGEDGEEASFAGMFDSVLNVENLASARDAVRAVWASFFGRRLLAYAHDRGVRPAGIAVLLQEQVDAHASGVFFTRDPRARWADSVLLEACSGLGDRLVSGAITPTRLRITRATGAVTVEEDGEDGLQLPVGTASAIVDASLRLEACFGGPQDVEWSTTRDGHLVILQSRPITVQPRPVHSSTDPGSTQEGDRPLHVWTNANIAENYPEPISPLLRSFVVRGYAAYFRGLGRAFGISRRRLEAVDAQLEQLVGTHAGRLYYDLSNIHTVLHVAPAGPQLAKFFNQFTGANELPETIRVGASWPSVVVELARVAAHVTWRYARVQDSIARFEREVDRYAAESGHAALSGATTKQLTEHVKGFLTIRLDRWTDAALADTAAMICYGSLDALLAAWLPTRERTAMHNELLKGLPHLVSAVPVEKLWSLSRRIREDVALHQLFREEAAEAVLTGLEDPAHADFRAALDDYLERWGFRYSGELMLTQPTPRENPLPVIRLLQCYVREAGEGPAGVSAAQARARLEATDQVERALTPNAALRALPLSRAGICRAVLRATQGAIRLRERARMKQALLYTRLRLVVLALGERLVERGRLERIDDVFYLGVEELLELAASDEPDEDSYAARIAARRLEERHWKRANPPDCIVLPAGVEWTPGEDGGVDAIEGDGALEGSPACGGVADGNAVVVHDVAEVHRVHEGDILVTRQTDPGWAAVFFLISGLVIERGGMLSHGAIIAREYGIPAVVGVREATRRVVDGEALTVDGDHGRVLRRAV